MVYVTSQPVHPLILEYYFQLLAGIPASHARSRLTLLCAYDASPRSLTEKILERPRLIQRIRYGIADPDARLHDGLQLDAARAQARRPARHPAERRRSAALGVSARSRGAARSFARPGSRCRRAPRTCAPRTIWSTRSTTCERARPGIRRAVRQARRELLGRGQRRLRVIRSRADRGGAARRARTLVLRRAGRDAAQLPRASSPRWAGSSRSSWSTRSPPRPSRQLRIDPARRGRAALDARPDPRRRLRAGLPGLPLPGRASAYRRQIQEAARQDRRRARPQGRRQPLRRRFLRRAASGRATPGTSSRSRSTCASAAPRTRSWRCSS